MTEGISVLSALFFISVTLAIVMLVAWRTLGHARHAIVWAGAFGCGSLQWLINIIYLLIARGNPYLFGAINFTGVVVATLLLLGFRERAHARRSLRGGVLLLLCAGALIGFGDLTGGAAMAMATGLVLRAALLATAARTVIRVRGAATAAELSAAIFLWLFAAFNLFVAALTIAPLEFGLNIGKIDLWAMMLGLPAAYTGVGLFAVLLLASDLAERMRHLASSDPLTNVLNRRGFREAAARALASAMRHGRPAAVVVGDIDRFKSINDRFGHATGDAVLVQVADLVSAAVRANDLFGRIGGEEFAFFLEDVDENAACEVIERIRAAIEGLAVDCAEPVTLTASFGVAVTRPDHPSLDDLFDHADRALYAAKLAGRNRVMRASDSEAPAECRQSFQAARART